MTQRISRRTAVAGGAATLIGATVLGHRSASAQSLVGPLQGAPTLVMFHVEAGW